MGCSNTFCISGSAASFRVALQPFQPMIMGEVDVLRVSTSRKARCHTGSHLLESHHALFSSHRLNVPIMVRRNQRPVNRPLPPETAPAQAVRRSAFNDQAVHSI